LTKSMNITSATSSSSSPSGFALVVSLAAVTVTALLAYDHYYIRKNPTIPGPPRVPFIGSILYGISYLLKGKDHELRDHLYAKYGTVVRQSFFGFEGVQITDPEFISKDFSSLKRAELSKAVTIGIFQNALFLLPNDDLWRKHRKYIQPGFGPSHLRQVVDASNHLTNILCGIWDAKLPVGAFNADGKKSKLRCNLFHVATSMTIDVVGLVAFSYSYESVANYESPEKQTAVKAFNKTSEIVAK
ncbi:Cytochrome P450 4d2, partial [Chytridiales sp. JEL 0842]